MRSNINLQLATVYSRRKGGTVIDGASVAGRSSSIDGTRMCAVIMNATKREDGEWRSLTNDEIWKAQRVVGAIYTGELASKLQELGYELRRTDEKGNFEVVGVTREQIEHYSQRRADIEASLKSRGVDMDSAIAQD